MVCYNCILKLDENMLKKYMEIGGVKDVTFRDLSVGDRITVNYFKSNKKN